MANMAQNPNPSLPLTSLSGVTRTVDESSQGTTSVIAPAVAPAAISGAAYFLGRYISR